MRKILSVVFFIVATSALAQTGPAMNFAPSVPQAFTAIITPGYNLTYQGATNFLPVTGGISGYGSGTITLSWTTNVTCASQINYGATTAYGSSVSSSILETTQSLTMTGLPTDGSTIHYQIVCPSSTGVLGETGDFATSTQGPTTLASLIYAGGHIGMTNSDPTTPTNYTVGNMPADAVYNVEVNATVVENDCKWAFTANAAGTVGQFSGCAYQLFGRFPSLSYRYHNVIWGNDLPAAMPITGPTWQNDIQMRENQINTEWSSWSAFYEVDLQTEPFTNALQPALPLVATGGWLAAGGPTWLTYPYAYATASISPSSTTLIGYDQYGWENTANWGGDPVIDWGGQIGITNPIVQGADKVSFDYAIETAQQALIAGTRIDSFGFEAHLWALYMYSSVDMKYRLWDIRRLGMVPIINELNSNTYLGIAPGYSGFGSIGAYAPGVTVNDSPLAQQVAANYANIFIYDFIRYGGTIDINFWTNAPNGTNYIELGPYRGNLKTLVYTQTTKLLQDVSPPALNTIPVVRRLGYYTSLPYAGTTSQTPSGFAGNNGAGCTYTNGCVDNFGTPGLITIPWTEYVYGSGGVPNTISNFSQTAWTFDIQFYSLGSTGGNIFEAVDSSNNQLVLVNWNAGNGNITVTVGAASPVVVGTISQNSYNALAITKNGTAFSFCLNGGAVSTTTATIAAIANLEWLDNTGSGNLNQQANLTTIDVYASQSVITGSSALQALSTFQNSQVYTYPQVLNWVVP